MLEVETNRYHFFETDRYFQKIFTDSCPAADIRLATVFQNLLTDIFTKI